MDRIYSRRRIQLPNMNFNSNNSNDIKKRKTIKIVIIVFVAIITASYILKSFIPIYDTICKGEAKSIATKISNEQATNVMKGYKYEDLFTIMKDKEGNITAINSNIITINEIISDVAIKIQEQLDIIEDRQIAINLGSFTGSKILSGIGPKIKLKISGIGEVETDFRSEFKAAGINQTLHRLYLQVDCKVIILTPVNTIEEKIINQVILAENIIVGKIPSTYYNLEGMDTKENLLEVME